MNISARLRRGTAAILAAAAILACFGGVPEANAAGKVAYGAATVAVDLLNIRSGPGTKHDILARVGENIVVVIIERIANGEDGEWFYINHEGLIGYAKAEFFKDILRAENFNAEGVVTGDDVFVRAKPESSAKTLADFDKGTTLTVVGINNGWYKVRRDGLVGYMRSDFMEIRGKYSPKQSARQQSSSESGTKRAVPTSTGNAIADFALQFVGYNYVYGGTSPSSGFDCSGLTTYTFRQFGVSLTRNASGQWRDNGEKISKSELIPGDLLFFSNNGGASVTHVGIYIGDDEFVHASGVRVGVVVSRLDSAYYTRVWYGAKRVSV